MMFARVSKLLIGLGVIVHFFACTWYLVGLISIDHELDSWLSPLVDEDASNLYRYLVAYHWCMAQFTPAPNNFHPQNWRERLCAVSVLFIGLILFTSLLGSITALINQ